MNLALIRGDGDKFSFKWYLMAQAEEILHGVESFFSKRKRLIYVAERSAGFG